MKKNAAKGYKKTKPKQTQFPQRVKLMQSLYLQRIMKMKPPSGPEKTNPNKANFNYPQRGKTEVRCRFSEVRYLTSAFCFLSSVQGPQAKKQSICVLKKSAKRFDFGG